jgi:hypothetical protein
MDSRQKASKKEKQTTEVQTRTTNVFNITERKRGKKSDITCCIIRPDGSIKIISMSACV